MWHLKSNLRKSSTKLLSYYQKNKKSMSADWFRKKYICNLKEIFCLQKFLLEEVIYTLIKFDFFNSLLCFGDGGKGESRLWTRPYHHPYPPNNAFYTLRTTCAMPIKLCASEPHLPTRILS